MDAVVTASISYPPYHQGEQYDNNWYAFGLLYQYPELLEDYSNAQDFFDELDTAKLGLLYAIYSGLNNLYSDVSVEKDTLELIMNRIRHQDSIILEAFDYIDVEVQNSENDSLFEVIDSISEVISQIVPLADSVRDSIEVAVDNKISDLSSDLSSITPSDSIQIKIKQVLTIWIDRIGSDTLTTAQVATLNYIASQCYYKYGTAVRLARILYPVEDDYDESECGESLILSNSDPNQYDNISIHPNPANDQVEIRFTGYSNGILSIVNLQGNKLIEQKIRDTKSDIKVDISNWKSGCYYVIINSEGKNKFERFVILK